MQQSQPIERTPYNLSDCCFFFYCVIFFRNMPAYYYFFIRFAPLKANISFFKNFVRMCAVGIIAYCTHRNIVILLLFSLLFRKHQVGNWLRDIFCMQVKCEQPSRKVIQILLLEKSAEWWETRYFIQFFIYLYISIIFSFRIKCSLSFIKIHVSVAKIRPFGKINVGGKSK